MLSLSDGRRYFLCQTPTDMRKSYNGLAGIVNAEHKWHLRSGDGFVFINRRRTMLKILIWDRSGFVIYQKRLDRGTFEFPQLGGKELTVTTLMLILEGIKISSVRQRRRLGKTLKDRA